MAKVVAGGLYWAQPSKPFSDALSYSRDTDPLAKSK